MERPRYVVRLSAEERAELEGIVKKGKGSAHRYVGRTPRSPEPFSTN